MLKTGEIALCELKSEGDLQQALESPVSAADHLLYAAVHEEYAKALIRHGLPCIFIEGAETEQIYGADMVLKEADDWDWKNDQPFLKRIWQRHYRMPWTIAETDRLLIRESVPEDFAPIYAFYEEEKQNPDVTPFPEEDAEEAFLSYIQGRYPLFGYGLWTMLEKESGCVVGRIGFEETETEFPELSVLIGAAYRGKGYAGEAAKSLLAYSKEKLGFPGVLYRTSEKNRASQALAEGLGFNSLNRYSLTKTQYESIYMIYLFRF